LFNFYNSAYGQNISQRLSAKSKLNAYYLLS